MLPVTVDEGLKAAAEGMVTSLGLMGLPMNPSQLEQLFHYINQHQVIKMLDLSNTTIRGQASFRALANLLIRNTSIVDLRLENCKLTEAACRDVLEALDVNTTLTSIRLEQNPDISEQTLEQVNIKCLLNSQPPNLRHSLRALEKNDPSLHEVTFANQNLASYGKTWLLLLAAIRNNTHVQSLVMTGCSIDCGSITALAKTLQENKAITKLDLSDNMIAARGAGDLAEALTGNPRVYHLNLRGNQIGHRGAASLITLLENNNVLRELDVTKNGLDQDTAQKVNKAVVLNQGSLTLKRYYYDTLANSPECDQIDLAYESLQKAGWLSHCMMLLEKGLSRNTVVRRLHLGDCEIGDEGCRHLAAVIATNKGIDTINVPNNKIRAKGAMLIGQALARNQTIVEMNMSNNFITDEALEPWLESMQHNNALRLVAFNNNPLSEEAEEKLQRMLTLNYEPLTLKRALPRLTNNTVRELDFSTSEDGRWHTSDSAKLVSIALQNNTSLTKLNYRGNSLGPVGATELAQAVGKHKSLTHIDLSENSIQNKGASAMAAALKRSDSLKFVYLEHNGIDQVGGEDLLAALETNRTISEMTLKGNKIPATLMGEISKQCDINSKPNTLKVLRINSKKNSMPVTLDLSIYDGVSRYDDEALILLLDELKQHTGLAKLNLSHNTFGPKGAALLAAWMKDHDNLMELILVGCPIGDEGVIALTNSLYHNQSVTKLDLTATGMTDRGLNALVECMQQANDTVTTVELYENPVSQASVTALLTALEMNHQPEDFRMWEPKLYQNDPKLLTLDFSKMPTSEKLTDISAEIMSNALKTNQYITRIDLSNNNISQAGARGIADLLKVNTAIISLDLSNNKFGDVGGKELVAALEQNDTLQELKVGQCGISQTCMANLEFVMGLNHCPKDFKATALKLRQNDPSLTVLDFSNSQSAKPFDNQTVVEMVKLLKTNTHVRSVDVSYNKIGRQGALCLAEYIKDNRTLQKLLLRGNRVDAIGATAFANALKTNCTLQTLDLADCHVPLDILTDIKAQLAVNRTKAPRPLSARRHPMSYDINDSAFYKSVEYHRDLEVDILGDAMMDSDLLRSPALCNPRSGGGYTAAGGGSSRLFLLN